ncbi:MAG: UDP-3-O-(3-hydroxymyristoyl)glucosamine N-acyltransferase [Candidatus Marinimicrobia bacterium]|nr:UDP-3-O-(3-hydroxymyristoyl)glucosamine N-acyltransferase [Candidatus Neomarinimicrobiota bacterium]
MKLTLNKIAEIVDGDLEGDGSAIVHDVAEIQNAGKGEITFLGNPKYEHFVNDTEAEAIIVDQDYDGQYKNLIKVKNVNLAFSKMLDHFRPSPPKPEPKIEKSAFVSEKAILGVDIYIGHNVVVEDGAVIENGAVIKSNSYIGVDSRVGANALINPRVTIYHNCTIGEDVIIHSGTVIGSDGYGYTRTDGGIEKIPQKGGVVIEDNVEVGANCTIDRGTISDTRIGRGTKLDNLIQLGHNVKVGKYCFIVAQTGIAGSTTIEDGVTIAGQVGIAGHIRIGKGARIAAKSGITKDVPPDTTMFWYPAREQRQARKDIINIRRISKLKDRVKELEKIIETKKG